MTLPVCKLCKNKPVIDRDGDGVIEAQVSCSDSACELFNNSFWESEWQTLMSAPSRRMARMVNVHDKHSFLIGGGFILAEVLTEDGDEQTCINGLEWVPGTPASVAERLGFTIQEENDEGIR